MRNGRKSTTANQSIYNDSRWWRARAHVLKRDRYKCVNCGKDVRGKSAARVDHIIEVAKRPDLKYDEKNLRTLCVACDAARHREKGGGGRFTQARGAVQRIGLDGFPIVGSGEEE